MGRGGGEQLKNQVYTSAPITSAPIWSFRANRLFFLSVLWSLLLKVADGRIVGEIRRAPFVERLGKFVRREEGRRDQRTELAVSLSRATDSSKYRGLNMSTRAPYATMHDLPKYEKRADAVAAPWFKDENQTFGCSHGDDPVPYSKARSSRTVPFATFHNIPATAERGVLLPETSAEREVLVEQRVQPGNGSRLSSESDSSVAGDASCEHGRHATQPNLLMVHQAPWDRDDVHYKVQPRFPHGEDAPHYTSSHAPFATDSKR